MLKVFKRTSCKNDYVDLLVKHPMLQITQYYHPKLLKIA